MASILAQTKESRDFDEVCRSWRKSAIYVEMETAYGEFFHKRGGRLPPGGGGRTVRGLSLLRANEALTSDLVTLQSVRLAQSSQDATSLAGFGNICRFSTICIHTDTRRHTDTHTDKQSTKNDLKSGCKGYPAGWLV